jgi:GT2 family glycosyltransferase
MTAEIPVTVAIATRDRPEALSRCLASLRAGSVVPAQVVVVDQSRGEATRRMAERVDNLVYIRHAGSGLGVAQNMAFSRADHPVIAVTDDDCVVDERWLEIVDSVLAGSRVHAAVAGMVLPLGPERPGSRPVSTRSSTAPREFFGRGLPWEVGSGNNFAVRREWLERVGGVDERLGPGSPGLGAVDMDLFYRLLRGGAHVRYEPAAVVFHERTTAEGRLARRFPYGHGMGAMCAIWLRRGDRYAVTLAGRWIGLRLRRLVGGVRRADLTLVHEEMLLLLGTARGVAHGIGLRDPGS